MPFLNEDRATTRKQLKRIKNNKQKRLNKGVSHKDDKK